MTVYIPSPSVSILPIASHLQGDEIRVAAFSCRGLEALSIELGFRVAIVAAVADVDHHSGHLRDLWYASGVAKTYDEWCTPFDFDNWDYCEWSKVSIDGRWFGGRPHLLDGSVNDGDLLLTLPPGVGRRAFSDAFRDGIADLRFEAVARRPANLVRRHHARRPVTVSSRYARASATSMAAMEVRDAIHFDPRTFRRVADVAVAALRSSADRARIEEGLIHLNADAS